MITIPWGMRHMWMYSTSPSLSSVLICAVISCSSLRFYSLSLTKQLGLLSLVRASILPAGALPVTVGRLFLQDCYCLALGEEELAELRLFCMPNEGGEALGQRWPACYLSNLKNAPVKMYVTPDLATIFPFLLSLPSHCCRRGWLWGLEEERGLGIEFGNIQEKGKQM